MENVKNENIEEVEEMKENEVVETTQELMVQDVSQIKTRSKSNRKIFTNITDQKKIFNLENSIDYKINDCKGEKIRVKEILIKIIETPLENPEIDEQTGEIIKEKDVKMITILIDDNEKSYVTGSKLFTLQFIDYINMFGMAKIDEGLDIEITEKSLKNSSNMALAFKLV